MKEGEEMLRRDEGELGEDVLVSLIEKRRQVHFPEIEDGRRTLLPGLCQNPRQPMDWENGE